MQFFLNIFSKYIDCHEQLNQSNVVNRAIGCTYLSLYLSNYLLIDGMKKSYNKVQFLGLIFENSSEIALKVSLLLCEAIVVLTCIGILTSQRDDY